MSFDVIFTTSAQSAQHACELEERARDAIAELPGEGLAALESRLFHAFSLADGTEVICSLTGEGALRVDACAIEGA